MRSLEAEQDYNKCVACNRPFTKRDEETGNKSMIQSTECFHMIHPFCFKDLVYSSAKRGEQTKCPKADCKRGI